MSRNYTTCRPSCGCNTNCCSSNITQIDANSVDYITGLQQQIPDYNDVVGTSEVSLYTEAVYIMKQSGTSDPTLTEVFNNTGFTWSVSRSNVGWYSFAISGGSPADDKISIITSHYGNPSGLGTAISLRLVSIRSIISGAFVLSTSDETGVRADLNQNDDNNGIRIHIRIYP